MAPRMRIAPPTPDELEPIQRAGLDELRAVQLQRLKWSLNHIYANVAHYRAKCDEAGAHPDHVKSLDDLAKFPFMTKEDLRRNYPFGLFAVPREKVVRVHASSGTTGKPTVVGYTPADLDTWAKLIERAMRAGGIKPGHIVHNAYGYGLFTGGLGYHQGAERMGCTVVPMSGGFTERQVQLITDFKPDVMLATPSYLLAIADEFDKQKIDTRACSLQVGLLGAEPWTEAMRAEIERRFDMVALDTYGISEVMGPGVGGEFLDTKDGATLWEDHFYPEIIDPQTGAVLPDGELGELVFTSLTKEAFPIVRYRTRDLTRLLPGQGRAMRRMTRIGGRSDDMMIIRGVNVFPTQIEELILKNDGLSPHYYLELHREGPLDALVVMVEARPETSQQGDAAMRKAGAALERKIKAMIGISAVVKVQPMGGVARSMGKAQRVVDKRPKA
ncbi:MAG: phenylacetate--CoA ligase PaaK [Alphaproteobacteria bacterium]